MYKILLFEINTSFGDIEYEWQLVKETEKLRMLLGRGYAPTMDEAYKEARKQYTKCKR